MDSIFLIIFYTFNNIHDLIFKELSSKFIDEQSAKNYAFIGFIFYALSTLGWLLPLGFFGGLFNGPPFNANISSAASLFGIMFLAIPI